MSRSSEISCDQAALFAGSAPVPFALTSEKQPVPQAGNPNVER